jgi:hypothetical protein
MCDPKCNLSHLRADVVDVNLPVPGAGNSDGVFFPSVIRRSPEEWQALFAAERIVTMRRPHKPRIRELIKQAEQTRNAALASYYRSNSHPAPARAQQDGTSPARDTEVSMPISQSERSPTWTKYELEAVKSLREVEDLTSLDRDTLVRVYPDYLVKLSPKRLGMKFRNVLKIMNGDAAA